MKCNICGCNVADRHRDFWVATGKHPDYITCIEALKASVAELEQRREKYRTAEEARAMRLSAILGYECMGVDDGIDGLESLPCPTGVARLIEAVETCEKFINNRINFGEICQELGIIRSALTAVKAAHPDPYGIYVGGKRVGEVPEVDENGTCRLSCPFGSIDAARRNCCGLGWSVPFVDDCKPGPDCPRHQGEEKDEK